MATGGHWWGGSVGTRGDYHFGDENDDLMEGDPALLIGAEGEDIELDCDEATIGCGMPGDSAWKSVGLDFGFEGPIAKLRGWWAKRQAVRLAALAPKRRRPARAVAQAQTLPARPAETGDDSLDLDSEAAPPGTSSLAIGAGGLVMGPDVSLSDRSFV